VRANSRSQAPLRSLPRSASLAPKLRLGAAAAEAPLTHGEAELRIMRSQAELGNEVAKSALKASNHAAVE